MGTTMKPTEPRKLYRTGSPQTSKDAAYKVDTAGLKQLVLDEVIAAGEHGITAKEILAKHPHLPYSSVTARPADLERDGSIYYHPGEKRGGARVMRATLKAKTGQLALI